jgi:hypothetical protein
MFDGEDNNPARPALPGGAGHPAMVLRLNERGPRADNVRNGIHRPVVK